MCKKISLGYLLTRKLKNNKNTVKDRNVLQYQYPKRVIPSQIPTMEVCTKTLTPCSQTTPCGFSKCCWFSLQILHSKLSTEPNSHVPRTPIKSAVLYDGSITDFDPRLCEFDIATCLEVLSNYRYFHILSWLPVLETEKGENLIFNLRLCIF